MNTTASRPTERAAIGGKNDRRLPSTEVLLTGQLVARMVGDRHGARLFACALDRATGLITWEKQS